jgi:DNA-binding CsgD family transcriptional regulator
MTAESKHRKSAPASQPARATGTRDPVRVDLAVRDYLQRLGGAASDDDIGAALAELGALFDMPNLELSCSSGAGEAKRRRTVYRSPHAPTRVVEALTNHPLYDWARDSGKTVSLSDAETMLNSRERARELRRIEGLMVNLEMAPDRIVHAGFYGTNGIANGLAKSLLLVGTQLACERHATATSRQGNEAPATNRERQVLALAMSGLTDTAVAKALGIAKRTVRFHLANASRKAGVATRAQLIAKTARRPSGTGPK